MDYVKAYLDSLHVDIGGDPVFPGHLGTVLGKRQILGHDAVDIDGLNTCLLQSLCESCDFRRVVKLCTVCKTSGPGEDRCYRVGRGLVTLLVFSVVSSDSSYDSMMIT